jgi:hypothetical protein
MYVPHKVYDPFKRFHAILLLGALVTQYLGELLNDSHDALVSGAIAAGAVFRSIDQRSAKARFPV